MVLKLHVDYAYTLQDIAIIIFGSFGGVLGEYSPK